MRCRVNAEIYLDRRLRLGETIEDVKKEMDALVEGKPAKWELGVLKETSWKGEELVYLPEHDPWKIAEDAELTKACIRAYEDVFGEKPKKFEFWDFGTNAVVPVSMGIPTIGFGPGEYKLAHMINERAVLSKLRKGQTSISIPLRSCEMKDLDHLKLPRAGETSSRFTKEQALAAQKVSSNASRIFRYSFG